MTTIESDLEADVESGTLAYEFATVPRESNGQDFNILNVLTANGAIRHERRSARPDVPVTAADARFQPAHRFRL